MFIDKYEPKNLDEFVGNKTAVEKARKWIHTFKNQKKKALWIEGPNGVGKTLLAKLLAKEMNYNLITIDSSESRKEKDIKEKFSLSSTQNTLFFKGKVFLFDELEGLSGIRDRGAAKGITEIIKITKHPVIITLTESDNKTKSLKKLCETITLNPIPSSEIYHFLKKISQQESIDIDETILRQLSLQSGGDIRAAIYDLELLSKTKKPEYKDLEEIGTRDMKSKLNTTITVILKTTSFNNAISLVENPDFDQKDLLEWIRENIPYEYRKTQDLKKAYYYISRADLFNNRIIKRQYWRFLFYVFQLLSGGIAVSKKQKYTHPTKLHYPEKIKKLAILKFKNAKLNTLNSLLSPHLHCSTKKMNNYKVLTLKLLQNEEYIEHLKNKLNQ